MVGGGCRAAAAGAFGSLGCGGGGKRNGSNWWEPLWVAADVAVFDGASVTGAEEALTDALALGGKLAGGVAGEMAKQAATLVVGEGDQACSVAMVAVVRRAERAERGRSLAHAGCWCEQVGVRGSGGVCVHVCGFKFLKVGGVCGGRWV